MHITFGECGEVGVACSPGNRGVSSSSFKRAAPRPPLPNPDAMATTSLEGEGRVGRGGDCGEIEIKMKPDKVYHNNYTENVIIVSNTKTCEHALTHTHTQRSCQYYSNPTCSELRLPCSGGSCLALHQTTDTPFYLSRGILLVRAPPHTE